MNIRKKILPLFAFVLIVSGFVGVNGFVRAAESGADDTIPDKVYVGDVAVGGMTEEEAIQAVETSVAAKLQSTVKLRAAENEITVSVAELGVKWMNTDVIQEAATVGQSGNLIQRYKAKKDLENESLVLPIEYGIDEAVAQAYLEENQQQLNQNSVENGLIHENGEFVFIEGREGIEVDIENAVADIADYFAESWTDADTTIEISANVVEPKGSREELEKVRDVLGSYSTDFSSSTAGRVANVKNATELIDGTVLYPGDEFSVYNAIGPLDAEHGYELAGAYENGATVESYGGGVCQVSTTLYNAAIRAELEITERFAHSMMVSYVQPSMDAAIAGTYKNLRFVNSTDSPIYLEGYTSGGILYFTIFGEETRPSNRTVRFESVTVSEEQPVTQYIATADPIGTYTTTQSAHVGKTAELWKIVTVDGEEVSREKFNSSKYNASPKKVSVGTGSDSAEANTAVNVAIASQDEAAIQAAIAEWNAEAVAARLQAEADAAAAAQQAQDAEQTEPEDTPEGSEGGSDTPEPEDTSDDKTDDTDTASGDNEADE